MVGYAALAVRVWFAKAIASFWVYALYGCQAKERLTVYSLG